MAAHNELGQTGEEMAVRYLERNGYVVKHRNWRLNHLELDIVAVKDQELTVVEVKTRSSAAEEPERAVDRRKRKNILKAADAYLQTYDIQATVHFDIIAIKQSDKGLEVEHITDAFDPLFY